MNSNTTATTSGTGPHVVQISFVVDSQGREPARLLLDWPSLPDVAEAALMGGARVSVVQACCREEQLVRNGVAYYFFAVDPRAPTVAATPGLGATIRGLRPDVLHVHGLCFPSDVIELASLAPGVPILLQDHASRPPRIWRRRLWRRGFAAASGVAFCAAGQSLPFKAAGLLGAQTTVYQIPESSSRFLPGSRDAARANTGLGGDPCLLWVGHLSTRKDPLAVLDGVSAAVRDLPNLQLWCCFGEAPLHEAVQRRIAGDERLRGRVHLLGSRPHEQIEQMMRAADFFVLGSRFEGSGYALIEALACGLPPVVTDIPSFRVLTGDGSVGSLWPCGDSRRLCEGLRMLAGQSRQHLRQQTREHFERQVSFAALGRELVHAYRDLTERRGGQTPT